MDNKSQIKAIFNRLRVQLEIAKAIALKDLELHGKPPPEFESGGVVSKLPDDYKPFGEKIIPAKDSWDFKHFPLSKKHKMFAANAYGRIHYFSSKDQRNQFIELIREEE